MRLFGCFGRRETSRCQTLAAGRTAQVVPGTGAFATGTDDTGRHTTTRAMHAPIATAAIRVPLMTLCIGRGTGGDRAVV
jgi:hypothetical protein